ncbi:MAG: NADH-quinone oxidoreductase subunit NuoF [Tissierellia bacterium]|nr:NADH-quinone oxidoreductase subunit NuoF [Tissierellia bacterium]
MDIKRLNEIKENTAKAIRVREEKKARISLKDRKASDEYHLLVCAGAGCDSSGGKVLREQLAKEIAARELDDKVKLVKTGCLGLCQAGPIVLVYPEGVFYALVQKEDITELFDTHIRDGNIVKRLVYEGAVKEDDFVESVDEVDFFKKQVKIALRNCGRIDPEEIDEYIAYDGYQALYQCLNSSREEVIQTMKDSLLRGRGGAGFPTGRKWESAFVVNDYPKYVICNGDEGDPGAFMDRSILEGDPHSVLEAMAICGYAIGSNKGYIYVRAEYPMAIERLNHAVKQAKEYNVLGDNIFGTDFSFDLEVRLGAGAFVCGEGTALMESIEGKRGMPRTKIHRTAVHGLWQKPTIINNVETFANVPYIFQKGAEHFRSIGTEKSPGTKVFALGGKINNNGLIEVPMGTTLREIVYDICGGIPGGKEFKAVQTGGPSGGCIPAEHLDTPVDFESLGKLGSIMGSGGMVILDEDNCMVDVARFFLDFTVDESCGKCTPCREGTQRMLEKLDSITEGKGTPETITELEEMSQMIIDSSLCGLGQSAPNPVLSTIRFFRHEYEAHVNDQQCPAGACKALAKIVITDKCIGCTKCARVCPVSCIDGKPKEQHVINQDDCIKCETCIAACPVQAIVKQ